jgi:hypothetical protein
LSAFHSVDHSFRPPTIAMPRRVVLPRIVTIAALLLLSGAAVAQETVDFNRDIRPILSDTCFFCHGPDEGRREADLRLDLRSSAFAERGGTPALAPGKPEQSELIRRITSADADERMPPADSGKELSAEQIELLSKWVAQGAAWDEHWSYAPLLKPDVPKVEDSPFVHNEIDRFVLARLNEAGVSPSPPAEAVTLARRLSFDLTGLPARADDAAAFARDATGEAYEALLDRLLASPHFGERMAVYWLDVVRYADSNGYHSDNPREMWLYRDYVIDAFNHNKPIDRFLVEQLAGDLLPDAKREQRIASAFNRLLQTTQEGGGQAKEYQAKYAADRVRNTAAALLGSTMGCCECHNHKFDPFSTKDFYSFAAFFADIDEPAIGGPPHTKMPTAEQQRQLDEFARQIAELKKQLDTQTPELDAALAKWEAAMRSREIVWRVPEVLEAKSSGGAELKLQDDGSILAGGVNPDKDVYTIRSKIESGAVSAIRLEALPDESLPRGGPGRAGNFVLQQIVVKASGKQVELVRPTATHSQDKFHVATALTGQAGWAILPNVGQPSTAVFEFAEPIAVHGPIELTIELHQNYGTRHTLGRFRISMTDAAAPVRADGGLPPEIAAVLAVPAEQRDKPQQSKLAAYWRSVTPELNPLRDEIAGSEKQRESLLAAIPELIVSNSMSKPRVTRILPRGNWMDDSGPVVQPAVPEFLGKLDTGDRRATRLDLARWTVSRDNPLTARVFVNRLWLLFFGEALARNPDDVGSQGAQPTHPALLDWLAADFVEHGWDVKRTIKLVLLSGAYRQSSVPRPELRDRDPYNKLLARQNRWRLPAEMVRDTALSLSGLLVNDVGGPSVKPYQPEGYWMHLQFPRRTWQADTGDSQYRRGLYTWWQRTFLHPSLLAFDAPTREECTAQRVRSNTPLQALALLNDPTYVEAARKFAERILKDGGATVDERIAFAFRQATSRPPSKEEAAVIAGLYRDHLAQFQADAAGAAKLLDTGLAPRDKSLDAAELAAWTSVTRTLLNLHETITRS